MKPQSSMVKNATSRLRLPTSFDFNTLVLFSAIANLFPFFLALIIGLFFDNAVPDNRSFTANGLFSHNFRLAMILALGGWLSCGLITVLLTVFSAIVSGFIVGANVSAYGYLHVIDKLPHFLPEMLAFIGFASIAVMFDFIHGRMNPEKLKALALRLTFVLAVSTILLGVASLLEERAF